LFVTEIIPPLVNNPGIIIKDKDPDDYSDIEQQLEEEDK